MKLNRCMCALHLLDVRHEGGQDILGAYMPNTHGWTLLCTCTIKRLLLMIAVIIIDDPHHILQTRGGFEHCFPGHSTALSALA